jgi:hypothetical protein
MRKIPTFGTSSRRSMVSGSRIETIPSPRLSARAASHSVWIAMAVEAWSVAGCCAPQPVALGRIGHGEDRQLQRRRIQPGQLQPVVIVQPLALIALRGQALRR